MKFTKILVIAALLGAISVDAIKLYDINGATDEDEADPDADAKQPKKIDPKTLHSELKEAKAAEA